MIVMLMMMESKLKSIIEIRFVVAAAAAAFIVFWFAS